MNQNKILDQAYKYLLYVRKDSKDLSNTIKSLNLYTSLNIGYMRIIISLEINLQAKAIQ